MFTLTRAKHPLIASMENELLIEVHNYRELWQSDVMLQFLGNMG